MSFLHILFYHTVVLFCSLSSSFVVTIRRCNLRRNEFFFPKGKSAVDVIIRPNDRRWNCSLPYFVLVRLFYVYGYGIPILFGRLLRAVTSEKFLRDSYPKDVARKISFVLPRKLSPHNLSQSPLIPLAKQYC